MHVHLLPKAYMWLADELGPRILTEFLKVYGTAEKPGPSDNPTILGWAKAVGLDRAYKHDSIAWCGLAMAYVAGQAGWDNAPKGNALWARNWAHWGVGVGAQNGPSPRHAALGDVLVFERGSGGHVALYVGEDATHFHCLGGNQSDRVSFTRIDRRRLIAARRCPWRISQPANVRRVYLAASGKVSTDEA